VLILWILIKYFKLIFKINKKLLIKNLREMGIGGYEI